MRRTRVVLAALSTALLVPVIALAGAQVPFNGADQGTWGQGTHDCEAQFPVVVRASGVATHVGNYAYSAHECVDFGEAAYEGRFTIAAANGDTIVGSYEGTFTVVGTTIHYEQDNVVGGGTGRFAGASGTFHVSGLAFDDLSAVQTLRGTISSVGSSK